MPKKSKVLYSNIHKDVRMKKSAKMEILKSQLETYIKEVSKKDKGIH
jgi:hypothetical protein